MVGGAITPDSAPGIPRLGEWQDHCSEAVKELHDVGDLNPTVRIVVEGRPQLVAAIRPTTARAPIGEEDSYHIPETFTGVGRPPGRSLRDGGGG